MHMPPGDLVLPVTLQYHFSELYSRPPPAHTALESGAREQQPPLELWKAKPGPDLPILEVPGFGVAMSSEE